MLWTWMLVWVAVSVVGGRVVARALAESDVLDGRHRGRPTQLTASWPTDIATGPAAPVEHESESPVV